MDAGVPDGEIQQLECRLVGREAAAGLDDLAQRTMQRLDRIGNRYKILGADVLLRCPKDRGIWCDHPGLRHREHEGAGRPMHTMSCELVLVAGRLRDSPGCAVSANP